MKFLGLFGLALVLSLVMTGLGLWQPLQAQVTVTNQASATFSDSTGAGTIRASSNETTFQKAGLAALRIIKTADRQAAEPGDVVVYRLLVENIGTVSATDVVVTDQLPLGLSYVENSVQASPLAPVSVSAAGRTLQLNFASLAPQQPLTIAYAALLTPDAIRGNGRNVAQVGATGLAGVSDAYQLAIRPGILSDCGTIIGRVFVDKNFDGEQQRGEPGVPNAVLFLDNGNRVVTDPDGLFSVQNAVSGNRVGTLDLSSLPGYTLAPNLYRISDNSQSRLVRLSPGGLARMNFAVTPTFGEGQP
ncbi:MAG TPA: hypothetical protein V6D06_00760 [Trichocoleus sp.]